MLDLLSAISAGLPQAPGRIGTRVSPVAEVHETHDEGIADLFLLVGLTEVLAVVIGELMGVEGDELLE